MALTSQLHKRCPPLRLSIQPPYSIFLVFSLPFPIISLLVFLLSFVGDIRFSSLVLALVVVLLTVSLSFSFISLSSDIYISFNLLFIAIAFFISRTDNSVSLDIFLDPFLTLTLSLRCAIRFLP